MAKFAFAMFLSGHAAAFSTVGIKTSRANQQLYYKEPHEDYGYQKLPTNGTIVFNDFEVRESEFIPSNDSDASQSAIEPGDKPTSKFVSPIQMIKLVPKVTPVANSSVFYVAPVLERPVAAPQQTETTTEQKVDSPKMKPKWSPRSKFGTNAFQSSSYLDSLSPSSITQEDIENKSLQSSLRSQQGVIREDKMRTAQEAMQQATRRTNPAEVIQARIEKAEEIRKQKEIEHLEKVYEERKQRLNDNRRVEREGKMTLERYAEERRRVDAVKSEAEMERANRLHTKRAIPILNPFLKLSQSTPLLVGGTITLKHEDLIPFQVKTLEVAQSMHKKHCSKMEAENAAAGKEGGIEAKPIVAILDQCTGDMPNEEKQFATLASVEVVKNRNGEPASVILMGVGRVFLHNYFSVKDAELTKEEVSEKIDYFAGIEEKHHDNSNENDESSLLMAEFDHFFDDSSHQDATTKRAAVTELYRTANKVYRLHEERKRLLSGLRAGRARLDFRETENEVEYNDWSDAEDGTETMIEDYGFACYGIFSTIPDLTKELLARLQPYYTTAYCEREEYEAEIASFVSLRLLEKHATPTELAAAMMAPSAIERLYMAYGIMTRHKNELLVLLKKINDDLRECGEDSSDLC